MPPKMTHSELFLLVTLPRRGQLLSLSSDRFWVLQPEIRAFPVRTRNLERFQSNRDETSRLAFGPVRTRKWIRAAQLPSLLSEQLNSEMETFSQARVHQAWAPTDRLCSSPSSLMKTGFHYKSKQVTAEPLFMEFITNLKLIIDSRRENHQGLRFTLLISK